VSSTSARVGHFDAAGAARLDRAYATPQIVEQRKRLRAVVAARPGEVGLDVGCGPGYLACELAREVMPGGRIVAIDHSDDMLDRMAQHVRDKGRIPYDLIPGQEGMSFTIGE